MKKCKEVLLDIVMIIISIAIGIFFPIMVSSDFTWNASGDILILTEPIRVSSKRINQEQTAINQEVDIWDDINTISKSNNRKILMENIKSDVDLRLLLRELFAVLETSLSISGDDFYFDSSAALIVSNDNSCVVEWNVNGMMFYDSGYINVMMRINEKGTITAFDIIAEPMIEKMKIDRDDIGATIKPEKDSSMNLIENIVNYITAKNHSEIVYCSIETEEDNSVTFYLFFNGETNYVQKLKCLDGNIITLMPV